MVRLRGEKAQLKALILESRLDDFKKYLDHIRSDLRDAERCVVTYRVLYEAFVLDCRENENEHFFPNSFFSVASRASLIDALLCVRRIKDQHEDSYGLAKLLKCMHSEAGALAREHGLDEKRLSGFIKQGEIELFNLGEILNKQLAHKDRKYFEELEAQTTAEKQTGIHVHQLAKVLRNLSALSSEIALFLGLEFPDYQDQIRNAQDSALEVCARFYASRYGPTSQEHIAEYETRKAKLKVALDSRISAEATI